LRINYKDKDIYEILDSTQKKALNKAKEKMMLIREAINFRCIRDKIRKFWRPTRPFDLFGKKNEMNIYDISIATIADQFLNSIKDIEKLQLEIAADFINLASYLVF